MYLYGVSCYTPGEVARKDPLDGLVLWEKWEAVLLNEFAVERCRRLGFPPLVGSVEVDVVQPTPDCVLPVPFEPVDQRPGRVANYSHIVIPDG